MNKWAHIENIIAIVGTVLIVIFVDGGYKWLSLLPLLFMNAPKGKKKENK